ncbi:hypothetical protein MJH12_17015 [bacterium]|nr:hypothetical protein [bacterium]
MINIPRDIISSFGPALSQTFDLKSFDLDKSKVLNFLNDELQQELLELNTKKVSTSRCTFFKVDGTDPEHYLNRLYSLPRGGQVICGIRHFGGNPNLPFLKINPNFKVDSKKKALEIYSSLQGDFQLFDPKYLSFWSNEHLSVDFIGSVYMVSSSKQMKQLIPWPMESKIELIDIKDDSYYPWYQKVYEDFAIEHPDLSEKVLVNSKELMHQSLEQNLLKLVTFDQEVMGLIAAEKLSFLGHEGLYFNEILICKEFKTRGLAKAIQRKFVQQFTSNDCYIWGTIDSTNLPSFKTALANGRAAIRYECFVNLK